jgi:hypothetical protein
MHWDCRGITTQLALNMHAARRTWPRIFCRGKTAQATLSTCVTALERAEQRNISSPASVTCILWTNLTAHVTTKQKYLMC